jgi:hypothetical protein
MGKDSQQAAQGSNRFRKEHNNFNPHNRLDLNRFHQVQHQQQGKQGHQLHKKKRDLERIINYRKSKGLDVEEDKLEELRQVEQELQGRKHTYEQQQRKEFFLSAEYKQVMNIEKRKVARKLREIREQQPLDQALYAEWLRKLNYIKFFPKTLKYVSLFPTTELSQKATQFQQKIMDDIEEDLAKKQEKLNKFEPEYKQQHRQPSKKDDFFLEGYSGEEEQPAEAD